LSADIRVNPSRFPQDSREPAERKGKWSLPYATIKQDQKENWAADSDAIPFGGYMLMIKCFSLDSSLAVMGLT
jgi:hypothetical protein